LQQHENFDFEQKCARELVIIEVRTHAMSTSWNGFDTLTTADSGPLNGAAHGRDAAHGREPARDPSDAQMDQIRDLLFGSLRSEFMARFDALEQRVVSLERQLAAAKQEEEGQRRAAFDSLAKGIADLSTHIRHLSKT
jgi:hypothetical protein